MFDIIDIYILLTTVIFGFGTGFVLLSPLKNRYKGRSNPKFIMLFFIAGIIISSITYFFVDLVDAKYEEHLNKKNAKVLVEADSLKAVFSEQRQVLLEKREKKSLIKYIQSYYDAYCINDLYVLDTFYQYPLKRFYTLKEVSKYKVHERAKFEYNHHKFRDCTISEDKTQITKISQDTTEVSIQLSKSNDVKIFTKILLNKQGKIFSIMNTIETPYYPKDSID